MEKTLNKQEALKAISYVVSNEERLLKVAKSCLASLGSHEMPHDVLFICGTGDYGKLGIKMAERLQQFGYDAKLYIYDCQAKADERIPLSLRPFACYEFPEGKFPMAVLVLDEYEDIKKAEELANKIRNSCGYIVAIDIPFGLDMDNGRPLIINPVKADLLISLGAMKIGSILSEGPDYFVDHEFARTDAYVSEGKINLLEAKDFVNMFPDRKHDTNKGTYGRASIIGGSKEYTGSVFLASAGLAGLKVGAGYANICIPASLYDVLALKTPEASLTMLKDKDGKLIFDKEDLDKIIANSKSIAIGMGLGVSEEIYKTVTYLLSNFKGRLIIDADGLNSLSKYGIEALSKHVGEVFCTPHLGEFSRLTGKSIYDIFNQSIKMAQDFEAKYNVTLVLKSSTTIVASEGQTFLCQFGNPGLAKGGSGDVLSGILAGLAAYSSLPAWQLAALASFILGASANEAKKISNEYSITASDVVGQIGNVITKLE